MCQYSIPFSVALAHFRDPRDPRSYDESALNDTAIRSLCERVTITLAAGHHDHATIAAAVAGHAQGRPRAQEDGRPISRARPSGPLDAADLRERFMLLTRHCAARDMERIFARLQNIENETSLDWLAVEAAAQAA